MQKNSPLGIRNKSFQVKCSYLYGNWRKTIVKRQKNIKKIWRLRDEGSSKFSRHKKINQSSWGDGVAHARYFRRQIRFTIIPLPDFLSKSGYSHVLWNTSWLTEGGQLSTAPKNSIIRKKFSLLYHKCIFSFTAVLFFNLHNATAVIIN